MKTALLTLGYILLFSLSSFAKSFIITGKVINQWGEPIAFATIRIVGVKLGFNADALGEFWLKVKNENKALEISSADTKETIRIRVGRQRYFIITLEHENSSGVIYIHSSGPIQKTMQKNTRTIIIIDSMKNLRDSIYNLRSNYNGHPLIKLISDLNVPVTFPYQNNKGYIKKRQGYLKEIILDLPLQTGFPVLGYKIILANKVHVDLKEIETIGEGAWEIKMKRLLEQQFVLSIKKWQ